MSTSQCFRFAEAIKAVSEMKDIKIVVFQGSSRNWSNGIHLNVIEGSSDPETEAWENIKTINVAVKAIYEMSDKLTIAAIQTNAGAGGVYFGLACDHCFVQ